MGAHQRCRTALPEAAAKLNARITHARRRRGDEAPHHRGAAARRCSTTSGSRRRSTGRSGRSASAPACNARSTWPSVDELPPDVSIALYRIVQEALTNIVKYAKARNVDVELLGDADGVSLIVQDDGVGLPAGAETNRLSHGISGMRQRVRALNGEFRIRGRRAAARRSKCSFRSTPGRRTRAPYSEEPAAPAAAEALRRHRLRGPTRSRIRRAGLSDPDENGRANAPAVVTAACQRLRLAVADLRVLDALVLGGAAHRVALLDRDLVLGVTLVFRASFRASAVFSAASCSRRRHLRDLGVGLAPSCARPSLPSRRRPSGCPTGRRTFPSRRRSRHRPGPSARRSAPSRCSCSAPRARPWRPFPCPWLPSAQTSFALPDIDSQHASLSALYCASILSFSALYASRDIVVPSALARTRERDAGSSQQADHQFRHDVLPCQ